jgi:nucleotide-binding universal stress UspA family protein
MPNEILVPVDSSEQAEKALEYAVGENPDASIRLVHAYGLEGRAGRGAVIQLSDQALEAAKERADKVLENAREVAKAAGYEGDIETVAESGDPEAVITAHAGDADAIYIGSHGRDGSARILLGSVAEKVVRRSPVPVTVVK